MKISNETKVGILAVVAIFLLIWGYNFLIGRNILSDEIVIVAEFDIRKTGAVTLDPSDPVKINGLRIGAITEVDFKEDNQRIIQITLNLDGDLQLPKTTVAYASSSFLGEAEISLDWEGECSGPDCLTTGDKIVGTTKDAISEAFADLRKEADRIVAGADSVLVNVFGEDRGKGSIQDLQATIRNLRNLTANLNNLMLSASANLSSTVSNLNAISAGLRSSNEDIAVTLANVRKITEELEQAGLSESVVKANTLLESSDAAIKDLQKTLGEVNNTLGEVNTFATSLNEGEGIVPMLLQDAGKADTLALALSDFQLLLQDVRLNPKRYTTVLRRSAPAYRRMDDPARDSTAQPPLTRRQLREKRRMERLEEKQEKDN